MDTSLSGVLTRAKEVTGRVLQATQVHQRPDLETRVTDELARFTGSTISVTVAGEVKRGKSSLINALAERDHLLPVGVDVTTNVRLAVGWADHETVVLQLRHGEQVSTVEELSQWVTETGNPGNVRGVSAVLVGVPSPLLANQVVLIDTPGVNSRFPGHRDMALAALSGSDAVLLVVDPDTEITAAELDLLREATARVGTVVLVVTKADLPHASEALGRTQAVVAREIPELAQAPALTVSAHLATLSNEQRAAGHADLADVLAADSGIVTLRNLLTVAVAQRAIEIRLANLMWVCNRVMHDLNIGEGRQLASLESQQGAAAEVDSLRSELRDLASDDARWRRHVQAGLQRIERDLRANTARAFLELRHRYQQLIADQPAAATSDLLVEDLDRSLDALYANTHAYLADQVSMLVNDTADILDAQGTVLEELRPAPALRDQLQAAAERPANRMSAGEHLLSYIPAFYAPAALGSVVGAAAGLFGGAAAVASVSVVLAPVAIPVMAGMVIVRRRVERRQTSRRLAHEAIQEALAAAKDGPDGLLSEVSRVLLQVGHGLQDRIASQLKARRDALEDQIRRQGELARVDASDRRRQAAEIQQRLVALTKLEEGTGQEYRRLHAAVQAQRR